uniref:Peptidase A2 domain-containing protein n=1 Tax=Trichuris muris TaxID=70415 RepID=A0A5S6Q052_TRIMR
MNLQLQGDEVNLVKTKSVIAAFISKLVPFKQNFGHGHLYQFPNLNRLRDNGEINDDDMVVYCNHLTMLHTNMCERYADILSMTIPAWILDPFWSVGGADIFLQEELIELQANEELKPKLKDGRHATYNIDDYLHYYQRSHIQLSGPRVVVRAIGPLFAQQNVSDEATKLQLAFTGMSDEVLASFRDFIFNATKEAKPFTAFKQLCLKRLTDSKERRIHQALHAEELGDRKPSEFLRYLQQLLERPLSDPILRELFLSRLPNHVRSTLVPFSDLELGQLAELADRVIVHQSTPICAVSQANAATEEGSYVLRNCWKNFYSSSVAAHEVQGHQKHAVLPLRRDWAAPQWQKFRFATITELSETGHGNAHHRALLIPGRETPQANGVNGRRCPKETSRCMYVTDKISGTNFLVDTGASVSVLPSFKSRQLHMPSPQALQAVNGTYIRSFGKKTLPIQINALPILEWTFHLADVQVPILGADFLYHHGLVVDLKRQILYPETSAKLGLLQLAHEAPQAHRFHQLLHQFIKDCDSSSQSPGTHHTMHVIETTGRPVHFKPRRLPPPVYKQLRNILTTCCIEALFVLPTAVGRLRYIWSRKSSQGNGAPAETTAR